MITHYWVLSIVYMQYPGWMRHFSFQFKAFICHSLVLKLTSEKIILILLRKYNKHIYVCVCIGSVLHQSYFCLWSLKMQQVTKSLLGSVMRSDHCRNPRHGVFQRSGIYRLQESSTAVKPSLQGEISWRTVTQWYL